jgi:hypothetical protein
MWLDLHGGIEAGSRVPKLNGLHFGIARRFFPSAFRRRLGSLAMSTCAGVSVFRLSHVKRIQICRGSVLARFVILKSHRFAFLRRLTVFGGVVFGAATVLRSLLSNSRLPLQARNRRSFLNGKKRREASTPVPEGGAAR